MNKRGSKAIVITVAIVIVAAISVGGYVLYSLNNDGYPPIVDEADESCLDSSSTNEDTFDCYLQFALDNEETAVCERAGEYFKEELCSDSFTFFGLDNCDDFEDIVTGGCIGTIANKINDPSLCENAGSSLVNDGCYLVYISETSDGALCENIVNQLQNPLHHLQHHLKIEDK